MTTKTFGRRLFARASMGVPLVLKGGPAMLDNGLMGGPPPPMPTMEASAANKLSLANRIWDAVRKGTRAEGERHNETWVRRNMMGGFDPDLAILNSMSHQHRVIRQIERDKAERERARGLRATIIRSLGGNPEDFE